MSMTHIETDRGIAEAFEYGGIVVVGHGAWQLEREIEAETWESQLAKDAEKASLLGSVATVATLTNPDS